MRPARILVPLALLLGVGSLGVVSPAEAPGPKGEPRAELLRSEGIRYYQARDYYRALRAFEEAASIARGAEAEELRRLVSRTRSALGIELLQSGEIRQATAFFREALRESEDAYAHFGLGFAHFVTLEDASALEHLQAALRLDPDSSLTHKLLGLIDYRQGRVREALGRLETTLKLDPKDKEAATLRDRWKLELAVSSGFAEFRRGSLVVRADRKLAEENIAGILARLEKARREIGEALQAEPSETLVVVLFLEESFHAATKSYHWVGGLYDGQVKLALPRGERLAPEEWASVEEAIRHEVAHVFVRRLCPACPNWLNEGIAQHFERPGRGGEASAALRERGRKRIRFEDVPARLWELDDEELARQTYLQGLGFVEFLVELGSEFRLGLLLRAIHEQGSLKKGFEVVYGLGLEEAEAKWWSALSGPSPLRGGGGR